MTKDEYCTKVYSEYVARVEDYTFEMGLPCLINEETPIAFKAGFNAGCKYYRKHILEL